MVVDGNYDQLLRESADSHCFSTYIPNTHCGLLSRVDAPLKACESSSLLDKEILNIYDWGVGHYIVDEYSFNLLALPSTLRTPQELLEDFLRPLNLIKARLLSDKPSEDNQQQLVQGPPGVGDWCAIGPKNMSADMTIVDTYSSSDRVSATFVTTDACEDSNEPSKSRIAGRRQFGVELLLDPEGAHRFYTRGLYRWRSTRKDLRADHNVQHKYYTNLLLSVAKEHGGNDKTMKAWARQIPGEALVSSIMRREATQTGVFHAAVAKAMDGMHDVKEAFSGKSAVETTLMQTGTAVKEPMLAQPLETKKMEDKKMRAPSMVRFQDHRLEDRIGPSDMDCQGDFIEGPKIKPEGFLCCTCDTGGKPM